jgi:hypothetical protein
MKDTEHNHLSNRAGNEVLKVVQKMKEKAKTSKPAQAYAEELVNVPAEIRSHLPEEDALKRTLRNQRSSDCPVTPNRLRDLQIEGKTNAFQYRTIFKHAKNFPLVY